jgi:tRNA pseudouridine32 synthase/23S rRNA pseudouridine746 synthase
MSSLIHSFKEDITNIDLPSQFNYPFYYQPHELAIVAARQLQNYLAKQPWFATGSLQEAGKMFGVLVIQRANGELGFLAAFSGKLAGETTQPHFVPPVYELDRVDRYFKQETDKLDFITTQIEKIESDPENVIIVASFKDQSTKQEHLLEAERQRIKSLKRQRRKFLKQQKQLMPAEDFEILEAQQRQLSLNNNFFLKEYQIYLENKLAGLRHKYNLIDKKLNQLHEQRRDGSNWLQDWLFDQYNFLNARGERRNVKEIFKSQIPDIPPAGTGDCAAPKLLQYAYQQNLQPITMAEFWYGPTPQSKVRVHGNYYPACRSKCEPVLKFMLEGVDVEANPLLQDQPGDQSLEILYEDEYMLAINKPADFLSVPGKSIKDSVQNRMKEKFPNATGPLVVHRLDMSTSGIMLIALSEDIYKALQQQFIKRTISKQYVAVLDGELATDSGFIDLPLRVDLDNRPYQLVDYEYGKSARTRYEVVNVIDGTTVVHFYPITGRTHQLRVHAAHKDGLGIPIKGDDLYGKTASRLHLHASRIDFIHPITLKNVTIESPAEFA